MLDTFEKFSNNYKKSLKAAAKLATDLSDEFINPWHVLYGLIAQRGSVGAELLTSLEIKVDDIRSNIAKLSQADLKIELKIAPKFSPSAKAIIQKSIKIAYINEHKYVGTEHLLAAILESQDANIENLLKILKVSKNEITGQVISMLKSASKIPALTETFKVLEKEEERLEEQLEAEEEALEDQEEANEEEEERLEEEREEQEELDEDDLGEDDEDNNGQEDEDSGEDDNNDDEVDQEESR